MQTYSRGKPITILKGLVLPAEKRDLQGTSIRFWPDKEGSYDLVHAFLGYGLLVIVSFSL